MKINKIKKMGGNKYKIYIDDDVFYTYDDVIIDNNLLYKKVIDKELYNKIFYETNFYDVYYKVVKYIMKKRRSEKEIVIYLNKFDIVEFDKNKIINKLKSINLIYDKEYCKAYINDKLYISKEGINKIKNDLIKQNIDINIIENELKNIDVIFVNEKLKKIILKKINSNNKYSNQYLRQKIINEMTNMGYDKEVIIEIFDNNLKDDTTILKNEFNKTYDKLKIKYSGFDLKNKVRQKLLLKGFTLENINLLLEEK